MVLLLSSVTRLANAASALPDGWGRPDVDAACLAAAVRVGLTAERSYDAAYDTWIPELLPWSDALPLPDRCAGRIEVWVASVGASDVTVCARVTTGNGRNACAGASGPIIESTVAVFDTPTEAAGAEAEFAESVIDDAAAWVDVSEMPHRVFVRGTDGRILRDLDEDEIVGCGRRALHDLLSSELAYDAAFDGWSADFVSLGYRIGWRSDDCDAWVAVRVKDVSSVALRLESVILEGALAGHGAWMGADGAWHDAGAMPTSRAWLASQGWLLEDGVDW